MKPHRQGAGGLTGKAMRVVVRDHREGSSVPGGARLSASALRYPGAEPAVPTAAIVRPPFCRHALPCAQTGFVRIVTRFVTGAAIAG
jgi:hypothetical protein